MNPMSKDIDRVLISGADIHKRVLELAEQISNDYAGKEVRIVCVLRGAVVFFAEIFKYLALPASCDFISLSSYGSGTESSGDVRLMKDLDKPVQGQDVLVVEDIVDSGNSLNYLVKQLWERGAASVKTCTLLDKPSRRRVEFTPDYRGFEIPDEFVVGYGLDYDEHYRNLPDVCILKPSVYEK